MRARLPLITVVLVMVNGGLAIALGWRLIEGSGHADLVASGDHASEPMFPQLEAPKKTPPESIQARAIFHKSRSFYVAPPAPQVVQPPPDYRLAGSMSVSGKESAVLIHSQTGARIRLAKGEQLEGWTVAEIERGAVKIQLGDRVVEITATSRAAGTGITLVGTNQPAVPSASHSGVRVIGNSPPRGMPPKPTTSGRSNQPPRLYRPPGNKQ